MTEVVEVTNTPRNRCVRCGSGVDKGLVCKEGKKCGGPSVCSMSTNLRSGGQLAW